MFCKAIVLILHLLFIFATTMGWTFYPPLAILIPIVQMSWEWNDNTCIFSKLEQRWFGVELIPGRIPFYNRVLLMYDMALFVYVHHIDTEEQRCAKVLHLSL